MPTISVSALDHACPSAAWHRRQVAVEAVLRHTDDLPDNPTHLVGIEHMFYS